MASAKEERSAIGKDGLESNEAVKVIRMIGTVVLVRDGCWSWKLQTKAS